MLLNGYVLDAVPLDSTAIYKGAASVPVPLSETASSYKVVHQTGSSIDVPLAQSANGLDAARGIGSTPITMTYYATAYKRAMAQAIENIGVATTGTGNGISARGSMLYIELHQAANGTNAARGIAVASMPLHEAGKAANVPLGVSAVDMMLKGRAGIPDPVIIRPGLTAAHASRWMKIGPDSRNMTVAPERAMDMGTSQDRTMIIDADRSA